MLLAILLFFLVVSFKFSNGLDLMFIAGLVFCLIALFFRSGRFVYVKDFSVIFAFSFFIVFLSFFVTFGKGFASLEYVKFGIKMFVFSVFAFSVANVYFAVYKNVFLEKLVFHLFNIIVFHSAVMVLMFFYPPFKNFVYSYSSVSDLMHTSVGVYRVAGFSGGGSALLSFFQALGFGLSAYLLKFKYISRFYFVCGNLLLVASVFFSGRVGLLVLVVFLMLYFKPFFVLAVFCISSLALVGFEFFYSNPALALVVDRIFAEFGRSEEISQSQSTISVLLEMIYYPDKMKDVFNFIFGTSSAGRTEGLWLYADIGYLKNWFMSGVIGFVFISSFFVFIIVSIIYKKPKEKDLSFLKYLVLLFFFLLFGFNLKEDVLVARHIFIFLMVLYFSFMIKCKFPDNSKYQAKSSSEIQS